MPEATGQEADRELPLPDASSTGEAASDTRGTAAAAKVVIMPSQGQLHEPAAPDSACEINDSRISKGVEKSAPHVAQGHKCVTGSEKRGTWKRIVGEEGEPGEQSVRRRKIKKVDYRLLHDGIVACLHLFLLSAGALIEVYARAYLPIWLCLHVRSTCKQEQVMRADGISPTVVVSIAHACFCVHAEFVAWCDLFCTDSPRSSRHFAMTTLAHKHANITETRCAACCGTR